MKHDSRFRNFIIASLFAHAVLFAFLMFSTLSIQSEPKTETVEISFVETEEMPPSIGKKMRIPDPTKIVETDSTAANNELSENARWLSERSNTVKKETRAKFDMKFKNTKSRQAAAPAAAQTKPSPRAAATQKLFGSGFDAYQAVNKQQVARELAHTGQGRNTASDSASTNDRLEGVSDDLITQLNTREYKYAVYYHRIKNQLNQWWVPKVQEKFTKMMHQGRMVASEESKITKLIIVLNNQGNLVNVQVLAESGVRDLDDAAIEAFRSAAPFPNPPKGMIDADGTVKIRWDCVVES